MYLHLGSDFVIKNTDIIAIFNIRNQKNNVFKNYLQKQCEKHKYEVIDLSENGEYSSCILTDDKNLSFRYFGAYAEKACGR